MLLCYTHCDPQDPSAQELCLIPDTPDPYFFPARLRLLEPTNAAVYRVSTLEAITVQDLDGGGKEIAAVIPSRIYLTPEYPDRPGMIVHSVQVYISNEGDRVLYRKKRGRGELTDWTEWQPNNAHLS